MAGVHPEVPHPQHSHPFGPHEHSPHADPQHGQQAQGWHLHPALPHEFEVPQELEGVAPGPDIIAAKANIANMGFIADSLKSEGSWISSVTG